MTFNIFLLSCDFWKKKSKKLSNPGVMSHFSTGGKKKKINKKIKKKMEKK